MRPWRSHERPRTTGYSPLGSDAPSPPSPTPSCLAAAQNVRNKIATSQIALPKSANDLVYAVAGYEASVRNAAQITLATDNVFSDGATLELATVTGDVTGGMTATLSVAI